MTQESDTQIIQRLSKELADNRQVMETVSRAANENSRVVQLLIAAGFVTQEKVEEARALLRPLDR